MSTNNRISRIGRNTAYNTLRSVVGTIVAFATGIVVARHLGPSETGIYALAIWVALAVAIVISDGLALTLTKFIAQQDAQSKLPYIRGIVVFGIQLQLILVLLGAGALAIGSGGLAVAFDVPNAQGVFTLAAVLAASNALMNVFSAPLNALERQGLLVPLKTTWLTASLIVSTVALVVFDADLQALVAAQAVVWILAAALHGVVMTSVVMLQRDRDITPATRRGIVRSSLALTLSSTVGLFVFTRSAVFLLGYFADTDDVAYYSIAYSVAEAAQLAIPTALAFAIMPTISRALSDGDVSSARRAYEGQLRFTGLTIMPVAVVGALLSARVVRVFYGDDFSDAAFPLAVLLVAAAMRMLGHCANWVLVSNDDERLVVAIYGVCATVSLGLGFALIPEYGINGALVAEACTQFAFMSTSMALVWRRVGFGVPAAGFLRIAVATIPVAVATFLVVSVVDDDVMAIALAVLALPGVYALGLWAASALSPFERAYLRAHLPVASLRRDAS